VEVLGSVDPGNEETIPMVKVRTPSGATGKASMDKIDLDPVLKTFVVTRQVYVEKCNGTRGKDNKHYGVVSAAAHRLEPMRYVIKAVNGAEAAALADQYKVEAEVALGHHDRNGDCVKARQAFNVRMQAEILRNHEDVDRALRHSEV